MKRVFSYLIVITFYLTSSIAMSAEQKRILMVVSGYGEEQGESKPGYEFDEFSKAYLVFKQHGIEVDVASPEGGAVEADRYDPERQYNKTVLQDKAIMKKLGDTLSTSSINHEDYDGIFIVGGKGAMFDLPVDTSLQSLIANIYQNQGSVAAVCHGPAALVDVKLDNGSYLVSNKAINGFTNVEEKLFAKKWLEQYPFLLEDKLVERGGKFQSSQIMLDHVAVDSRLITGQNPSSTVSVASELVKSLGIDLLSVERFKDDRTLSLVADILEGKQGVENALNGSPDLYQIELIGMYGYYYLTIADTNEELKSALKLMTLGQKAINNPRLDMQIAQTQHKLGDKKGAVSTLTQILASNPDFAPAQDMLKTL